MPGSATEPMTEQNLDIYSDALSLGPDGVFVSRLEAGEVHFPEQGHGQLVLLEDGSFWFRHRNRCIVAAVRNHPPRGPLFDVGGGNGFVSRGLKDAGFEVVLVEPGPVGCANARRRGLDLVVRADFGTAGFRAGVLPGVGLFDVLEHVRDDVGFLRDVARALAPGGRLYLTVPAYQWLWSEVDAASGHFRRYTRSSLAAAVASAGLRVAYGTFFFLPLPPVMLLTRVLRQALRRQRQDSPDTRSEHSPPGARLLEALLGFECASIARGASLPGGASLLLVAAKD